MAQSIDSKKFGTLDTSGKVPVSLTGVGTDPALGLGLSFNVGGKDYTFIPEDRITQGAASGTNGALFTGFLNPTLLSSLKNSSDYVDLSGVNFGSFDAGNFVTKNMGGATKGFLAPKEVVDPILAAGITTYDPSWAGKASGIGNANGKPAFILPNGYADDSGRVTKTETKITGYTSSGGGWLNSFVNNPLGTVSETIGNVVKSPSQAVGEAWNSGGRDAAAAVAAYYGIPLAAEYMGAGAAAEGAGALASQTAAEASSAAAASGAGAGAAGAGAATGAGALAAQTAAEASSAVPYTSAGAGAATGAGALAAQTAAEGSSAVPYAAGAGAAAAGTVTPSWMMPAAMVGSSLIGATAAQTAAKTQADAAAQANQLLYQQYLQQRTDLAPFTGAGIDAQNKLLTFLGLPGGTTGADYGKYAKDFTSADFLAGQDPGYAFRLSEGQKALERSAAARGGLLSGGAGKALASYGQQMGSQEYQNAYNRYQTNRSNQLAPLFSLTGSGQAAAANQAAAAGNYATGAANNLTSAGAANAAGTVGTANALTGGLNSYLNYSGQQDLLAAYNARTAAAKSAYS